MQLSKRVEKLEALHQRSRFTSLTDEQLQAEVKVVLSEFIENPALIDGLDPDDQAVVRRAVESCAAV